MNKLKNIRYVEGLPIDDITGIDEEQDYYLS